MTGKKTKNTKIISNVQNVKWLKLVLLPEHFLACRQTFVEELHKKKTVLDRHTVAPRRENRPLVHEKPGCWSCEAGGRYSQCSFCMKLSVYEKAVVGSRWSLFAVVAEGRFYCIKPHRHSLSTPTILIGYSFFEDISSSPITSMHFCKMFHTEMPAASSVTVTMIRKQ